MTALKVKSKQRIKYHQNFTKRDLLLEAHSVRFKSGLIYINLGTGDFCEQSNPSHIKSLDLVYQHASTVMNIKRKLIAARPKLKACDPTEIHLRRITFVK
ncbi:MULTISPECIES: hypothetical protein [Latilactobacillus]|uniref:Uncharacterized protein n=1 Tax=Latilactobacillus curvatus TaxID=28038 RepID=A0ABN6GN84_LATCU|nr:MULTISPECIES: hypothetical protein [Latilactobacillus]ASN13578.1 hypothetical protein B4V05_10120 [Latilactobacillus sakei]KGB13923.1 hypothetical protein KY41_10400 [Latilactobacillus sakei]MCW8780335.1 hypothetical protein [Latilactobacillus curvatus]UTB73300.1 hypothetical protein A4W72_11115 [Latilactobacillus curvatus]BCX31523.1 hypothetical protein LTWDN19_20900 [Latilactobacillus curvatus]